MIKMSRKQTVGITMILLVAVICSIFIAMPATVAEDTQTLTNINYEGTSNYCSYGLIVEAATIDKFSSVITNDNYFCIYMKGIKCRKNIFTTFTYDLSFTLFKDGIQKETQQINFKVTDANKVKGDIRNIFFNSYGNGNYTIHIVGTIKTHTSENINKSAYFKIEE